MGDWSITTISDKNATKKMPNIAIKVIKKSVLPLMDIALTVSRNIANMVGPIAGGNHADRREEVSKKKNIYTSCRSQAGVIVLRETDRRERRTRNHLPEREKKETPSGFCINSHVENSKFAPSLQPFLSRRRWSILTQD